MSAISRLFGDVAAAPVTTIIDSAANATTQIIAASKGNLTPDDAAEIQKIILANTGAVNLAEANNPRLFVSGWRPFIGWICGIGLAYAFIVSPVLVIFAPESPAPQTGEMMPLVVSLLGLGGPEPTKRPRGQSNETFPYNRPHHRAY